MMHLEPLHTVRLVALATVENSKWRPGIGDPTLIGWTITIGYLVVFLLCLRLAVKRRRAEISGVPGRTWPSWGVLAGFVLLLGINKQLDLQVWLCLVGKQWAKSHGLYQHLALTRMLYIVLIIETGLVLIGGFFWMARRILRSHVLALVGVVFLASYVSIRALAFYSSIDQMLSGRAGDFTIGWLLELAGLVCVGISALQEGKGQNPAS